MIHISFGVFHSKPCPDTMPRVLESQTAGQSLRKQSDQRNAEEIDARAPMIGSLPTSQDE